MKINVCALPAYSLQLDQFQVTVLFELAFNSGNPRLLDEALHGFIGEWSRRASRAMLVEDEQGAANRMSRYLHADHRELPILVKIIDVGTSKPDLVYAGDVQWLADLRAVAVAAIATWAQTANSVSYDVVKEDSGAPFVRRSVFT